MYPLEDYSLTDASVLNLGSHCSIFSKTRQNDGEPLTHMPLPL